MSTVCFSFREKGECRFADKCRFSHDLNADDGAAAPAPKRAGGECFAWKTKGSCKFAENCRFSHDGAAPANGEEYVKAGRGRRPRPAAAAAASGDAPAVSGTPSERKAAAFKQQECYTFRDTGACEYAEKCRFAHGKDDTRDLLQLKRRAAGICFQWRDNNSCQFNERCRYSHSPVRSEGEATA